jgi:cysteinyl-tRNA synthetase
MKLEEFRSEMESYRSAVDEEARAFKDSYLALDRLQDLYRKLEPEERVLADQVLAEWVLSDDEKVRFDAMALVDDFKVASAVPALRELASRLVSSSAPGAPYERKKVERIIKGLMKA